MHSNTCTYIQFSLLGQCICVCIVCILYVSCMYSCRHISIHMCMYCMYCMYAHVCSMYGMYWPRQALNAYVCVLYVSCMYLFVLYVFAPTSTDASTTSPKDPPLGRHPAGPTQGTPGQVADHFFRPSETHPRTRFGAPARAARVGGSKVHPLLSQ